MTIGQARELTSKTLVDLPEDFSGMAAFKRQKTHDYTRYEQGVDYVFEAIEPNGAKGYLTCQGKGVKQGDYVILRQSDAIIRYRIERIDYYSSPSDMWIALLVQSWLEQGFFE
ncbi:MAG: hypothetical protein K6T90_18115 [Leptolyngbyaceae cyanobacterium HOT.MB2.61]|jgi:hypothetical protein|nr:hypothetical protein [Leptolyngbyaceae cyanobacterium HOT.MB2.61]